MLDDEEHAAGEEFCQCSTNAEGQTGNWCLDLRSAGRGCLAEELGLKESDGWWPVNCSAHRLYWLSRLANDDDRLKILPGTSMADEMSYIIDALSFLTPEDAIEASSAFLRDPLDLCTSPYVDPHIGRIEFVLRVCAHVGICTTSIDRHHRDKAALGRACCCKGNKQTGCASNWLDEHIVRRDLLRLSLLQVYERWKLADF